MISEIYCALKGYYGGSVEEALLTLRELIDYLSNDKFKNMIEEYIKQVAIENEKCPSCLNELNTRSVIANTHEYMGSAADEIHEVLYCNQCGEEC